MDADTHGVFYMDKLTEINLITEMCWTHILNAKRRLGLSSCWRKNLKDCRFWLNELEEHLIHLENLIKEYNQ